MINCPVCGTPNPGGSRYCSNCGSRISIAEPNNNEANYAQPNESGYYPPQYNYSYQQPRSAAPGDSSKNWAGITGFIMGILSVMAAPILSFLAIPGFILSIIGTRSQQRGLSVAGIILSVIGFLVLSALVIFLIAFFREGWSYIGDMQDYMDGFGAYGGAGRDSFSALVSLFLR